MTTPSRSGISESSQRKSRTIGRMPHAGMIAAACAALSVSLFSQSTNIGREVAALRHLADGEEYTVSTETLLAHGLRLFTAMWTVQEGGGRPFTKGTGAPLAEPSSPLVFPRNFNRISGPDSNSCAGCHTQPFGTPGGSGDIVANVFVLGQRFDFLTFDALNSMPTGGSATEDGRSATLQDVANSRKTIGMFGSGYIEMLARQMTEDLQGIRDRLRPGMSAPLVTKGVSFGALVHNADGTWDTSRVEGLAAPSASSNGTTGPTLIVRPFHQAGAVISLRQFTNNAFNHHHGIQSSERFGHGVDADGDGFVDELTRADITAVSLFQATMAVPGRVIPDDSAIEAAVMLGERKFTGVGCASCHLPALPLDRQGWFYSEPNPFNPAGNLRVADAAAVTVDLGARHLPEPRLQPVNGVVWVPAFTDLKLHDITSGPSDPNREPLDMNAPAGTAAFMAGNSRFLTRKLWGVANQGPYFHHGQFTTMREAILAHAGEAAAQRAAFEALTAHEQDCVIEFLKTLQVLRPGTRALVVDEHGRPKAWSPNGR